MRRRWLAIGVAGLVGLLPARGEKVATGTHGAISTIHPLATQVGLDVLKRGGNAVDAAVAVGLALGVVDPHHSGLGGGCFLLIRKPNGEIIAIDGRECAPAAATRETFLRDGKADPKLSQIGPLACGVPGALAAYAEAAQTLGRKSFADLIAPSIPLAEDGFAVHKALAKILNDSAEELGQNEAAFAVYGPKERLWQAGDVLKQSDLAQTYRAISSEGTDWFYRGAFAEKLEKWMQDNGGVMTAKDLAEYKTVRREPIRGTYRGHEIVSFPPPSSGGIHVIQILQMLERFDLGAMEAVDRVHVVGEAMKLAFADRAYWLGDPAFAPVPRGLIARSYTDALSARIQMESALAVKTHGEPAAASTDVFDGRHTTHFSVADEEGWWVACTATINTAFGSKVVIPGTGLLLNNEMDDFSLDPGVPNYFGLIGSKANAVEPRKRPLSSMSPTIVLKDGKPILAVGAAGGPTIITQTVGNIIGVLDLGLPIDAALAAPRVHHQWQPGTLRLEETWDAELRTKMQERGHELNVTAEFGGSNAVSWRDGTFTAASEPRSESGAGAW
jgi:gamma-glutamyltranspeptidase/glutathione hydrolase